MAACTCGKTFFRVESFLGFEDDDKRKREKMMKKILIAFLVPAIGLMISCKNFGSPDYSVTVILGPGISGTPAAGTSVHKEFDSIDYSYGPLEGATVPTVTINGTAKTASGTLMMFTHVQIEAYQTDIRGTWSFVLNETSTSTTKSQMDVTFSGTSLISGTFMDSQGNGGEWGIGPDGDTLVIAYSNWFNTAMAGTLSTGYGTWAGFDTYGTWTATKK
jgi:hypothetical protein